MTTAENTTRTAARIASRYIPKDACKIALKDGSATVYTYQFGAKFAAIAFRGTAGKNEFHTVYRTEAQRAEAVTAWLASVQASVAFKAERRAQKAAWTNPLTVGAILYTSWGYDQTNVDFFVVTRVSGRRVWVRPIASDYEATGHMSGKTWPAMPIAMVGDESMHVAQPSGADGVSVKIGGHYAWLESGREHHTSSYA